MEFSGRLFHYISMTEKEYSLLLSFAHPIEAVWLRQTQSLSLQHHLWMLQPHHVKILLINRKLKEKTKRLRTAGT